MDRFRYFFTMFLSLIVTNHVTADVTPSTTLGTVGSTDLQILTGDFVQRVCAGFIQNGGAEGIEDSVNAAAQLDLFDKCGEMVQTANRLVGNGGPVVKDLGISQEQLNASIQNVATEEAAAIGSNATELSTTQSTNIGKRIASLMSGKSSFKLSIANFTNQSYVPVSLLAADDNMSAVDGLLSNRWGLFANGVIGSGVKEETESEDGFVSTLSGITMGADYRLTSNAVAGFAAGFERSLAEFTLSNNVAGGDLEFDSASLSAFGLWFNDHWYADAIVTLGDAAYRLNRRVVVQSTANAAAVGNDGADLQILSETNSTQIGASATAGFEYSNAATTIAPYTRVSAIKVEVDSYEESGGAALALRVREQSIKSLTAAIGLRAAHIVNMGFGVLAPQVTLEYIHEFEDDSREISALYINDPRENVLSVATDAPDRSYGRIGLAVSSVLKNGWQLFADAKAIVDLDTTESIVITVGGRKEF